MPGRLRQSKSRAAASVAEESEPIATEGPYNIPQLEFNEPLTWRAGRAIPVADLFTRLQKLSKELRTVDQNTIEVTDIAKLAQDLVHPNLLGHKDKGIRAWTVCCVVDILNICAPNAPYKNDQLRDIFTVIINSILPALADSSNAYNTQHQYILQQLVEAESIVLITDIQEADPLLTSLFTICFDVVSGSGKNSSGTEIAKTVEYQIHTLLSMVVDEAMLPQDVIDIIISQFLRVDPRSVSQPANRRRAEKKDKTQSTLLLKDYPAAYNMAKVICTSSSAKMSGAISQYYSNIVSNATAALSTEDSKGKTFKRHTSPASDSDSDDDEARSLSDLKKVHRLIKELWRACPDVLVGVIPQCEIELAADSMTLRQLAVETLGDLIAGIGLAGLPDLPTLDPAADPLPTIMAIDNDKPMSTNPLLNPSSPKPFMHVHASAYQAFLGRRIDKAPSVRTAWATAVSRVLLTRAGSIGLSEEERATLVAGLSTLLKDIDEKVRLIALQSLTLFPYYAVIKVLGSDGGLSKPGSLLSTVAERVVDKKLLVREQAMQVLANMWGVASRDIADGVDEVRSVIGPAPSHILSAMYVKDSHVTGMLLKILYESLLPLNYPSVKSKATASSQKNGESQTEDADSIRVRRLLTLVRDLDDKAKPVFFGLQKRQADMVKALTAFLKCCEDYNGGVAEDFAESKQLEEKLKRMVEMLSRQQPDASRFSVDLHKFAKAHDRRSYQLIRFMMGSEHDFRTMTKAMKEFNKRIREGTSTNEAMLESLTPLLYSCALVCYNRSHLPAIIEYSRSADADFSDPAQELLREISEKVPEVMKSHIKDLCTELESAAPTAKEAESSSAVDSLKACATFAKKFPEELPKERKFEVALMHFIEFSTSPKAAKHATTILLKTSNKKELRAREIITKAVKRVTAGASNRLAHLAAIAQVCLLAPEAASAEEDRILTIVTNTLNGNNTADAEEENLKVWSETVDEDTLAKTLVLRILVNRCRSGKEKDRDNFDVLAQSVIDVLMKIIEANGETASSKNTPNAERNRMRLAAARGILKLCRHKPRCEELVAPQMFETIGQIMINPPYAVRRGVLAQMKKYLNTNSLASRWFTIFFLTAFEVDAEIKTSTIPWLKSRAALYVRQQQSRSNDKDKKPMMHTMELTFARLLSLLIHHPDYPAKGMQTYDGDLLDFAKYIIFYLQTVATDDNLSLIFHIAQRVKQAQDALSTDPEVQERLYVLSDLAQATIRNYADLMPASARGNNLLQTYPGKAHLPNSLFSPINGHVKAQEIAAKNYLPEDVALGLEQLVRQVVRNAKAREPKSKHRTPAGERKRKISFSVDPDADGDEKSATKKKARSSASLPIRKTPVSQKRKIEALSVEQPSRKSARTSNVRAVNYIESDEDDEGGDDVDNIVKYNPGPTAKSAKRSTTKDGDEVEEEGVEDEEEEEEEGIGSPTPQAKTLDDDDDAQMSEPEEDNEATNASADGNDEEMVTDENQVEHELEEESEPEAEELETTPESKTTRRSTRGRGASKAAAEIPANVKKPAVTTKAKSSPAAKPTNGTKRVGKAVTSPKTKMVSKKTTTSSPAAPEPTRRSSRRGKV